MTLAKRISRWADRFYNRARARSAFNVAHMQPSGTVDQLRGNRYCVLVSYRRDGSPVPTPLWFGLRDGRVYAHTAANSAKVARIRRNPEVRVAPSTSRGRPRGAPFVGRARILDEAEAPRAEEAIAANYGWGRRIYARLFVGRATGCYLEVVPVERADGR